jgi:hypothetical protein
MDLIRNCPNLEPSKNKEFIRINQFTKILTLIKKC